MKITSEEVKKILCFICTQRNNNNNVYMCAESYKNDNLLCNY